ncbi:MAG TPA: amidohydrolase family protein [Myxococcaceae bacterium]|nr:amidohydrolase family protein [Myxococcaceae bacterium]
MRCIVLALVFGSIGFSGCRTGSANIGDGPEARRATLAFRGALVRADGTVLSDAVVLVHGDRITGVGSAAEVTVPEGTPVVGGPDKWIVPGLIDAHVHFFQSGGMYTRPDILDLTARRPYAEERAIIRAALPRTFARYLRSGVTAVVDVGGPMWNFEVRRAAAGHALAPRVAAAGPLLSSAARPQMALDDPPILQVTDPARARALVREMKPQQPDLVKLWWIVPPGGTAADWLPVGQAAIDEAHQLGLRVAVHATELETARTAVKAGADVLVHSVSDVPADDAFHALLRERKVPYTTSLVVLEGYAEALSRQVRLSSLEQELADPFVIATLVESVPGNPTTAERMRRRFDVARENVRRAQKAGVVLAAGTDAGNIGTLHGPAMHRELEILVEAGLTPAEALRAATTGAARVFGREDIGSLEKGNVADALVLDANPLEDVRNLARIHRVVKAGVARGPAEMLTPTPEENAQREANTRAATGGK